MDQPMVPQPPVQQSVPPTQMSFNPGEMLAKGWHSTMGYFGTWLMLMVTFMALEIAISLISYQLRDQQGIYFLFSLFSYIVSLILGSGLIRVSLRIVDRLPVSISDLFATMPYILRYFLASLLVGVVIGGLAILYFMFILGVGMATKQPALVLGGSIIFIPLIIYLSLRLSFINYLIVDRDAGVFEAFSSSMQITNGQIWSLIGLTVLLILINIATIVTFGLGLLVTIPTSLLAMAHVYRTLVPKPMGTSQPEVVPQPAPMM